MSDIILLVLPFDILSKIFSYLTRAELRNVMLTCKALKQLIEEDITIWKAFAKLFVRNSVDNRCCSIISFIQILLKFILKTSVESI